MLHQVKSIIWDEAVTQHKWGVFFSFILLSNLHFIKDMLLRP